jgi:hypothetical protein
VQKCVFLRINARPFVWASASKLTACVRKESRLLPQRFMNNLWSFHPTSF